jgi:hypothetical protein
MTRSVSPHRFDDGNVSRRDLLRLAALAGAADGSVLRAQEAAPPELPLRAQIARPVRDFTSHGDTWTSTWADDGNVYTISDDTMGFHRACSILPEVRRREGPPPDLTKIKVQELGSNVAVHRLTGDPPRVQGETVNPMREYGGWAESSREDGATWKGCGLTCVDGVLYLSVSRHPTPFGRPYQIQQSFDSTILKSMDHGKTGSPPPKLNQAMFPGRLFANPFFVQYGKDGQGDRDGADQWVYAVSNDGCWNNGNFMILGRVRRDRIGRLDARDWEFVHGFNREFQPLWLPRHDNATYIFRSPNKTGMAGIYYIAGAGVYLLPQWYYTEPPHSPRRWIATCWELYQSPAPWGPWRLFHRKYYEPEGFYNPSIVPKFTSADGRKLWMLAAGYFLGGRIPEHYGLNLFEVTLKLPSDPWAALEKAQALGRM